MKQSNGGFGCYLLLAHEWANPEATKPQLRAHRPARVPAVPGPGLQTNEAERGRGARPELAQSNSRPSRRCSAKYQAELGSNT